MLALIYNVYKLHIRIVELHIKLFRVHGEEG